MHKIKKKKEEPFNPLIFFYPFFSTKVKKEKLQTARGKYFAFCMFVRTFAFR